MYWSLIASQNTKSIHQNHWTIYELQNAMMMDGSMDTNWFGLIIIIQE